VIDGSFVVLVVDAVLRHEVAAASVGFKRSGTTAELLRKAGIGGVARAIILVNVNGSRLRKRFDAGETIVGEENPAVHVGREGFQAMAAWGVIGGQFSVSGKTVERGTKRFSNFSGNFGCDCFNAKRSHVFIPRHWCRTRNSGCALHGEKV